MRQPVKTTLRGLRPAEPRKSTPAIDAAVPVLYLASAGRDRLVVRDRLTRAGATVTVATDMPDALRIVTARRYGLVVVDLAGEAQSIATIRLLRAQSGAVPVVGVVDPGDTAAAGEALNAGAADVLPWPFEDRDVLGLLASARDGMAVSGEVWPAGDDRLFAHSPAMRAVVDAISAATTRRSGMLLVGAPGTGRTQVARFRHTLDHEFVTRPFICVDCSAHGVADLERRLFGVESAEAPSFTPAESANRTGGLIAAQGGTLFLKNLTAAPARVQARLAGVLRDGEVHSADVEEIIRLDVRVVAACGPDVDAAVADGRLRRDLFDRLAHTRVEVPSFPRRHEDLPFLAVHTLREACAAERTGPRSFSRAALAVLAALPWSGNAAEMAATIGAIVRHSRQPVIQLEEVLAQVRLDASASAPEEVLSLRAARGRFEREFISRALIRHHGRVGEAARSLGIQRTNLYRKARQLKVAKTLFSSQK